MEDIENKIPQNGILDFSSQFQQKTRRKEGEIVDLAIDEEAEKGLLASRPCILEEGSSPHYISLQLKHFFNEEVDMSEIPEPLIEILRTIVKCHGSLVSQLFEVKEEDNKLRLQTLTAQREIQRHVQTIGNLTQETATATSKLQAHLQESRDLKNQWLQTKTGLENEIGRLNSQITLKDATARKKEQNCIALQRALEAKVKQERKGSETKFMMISKPLPKNSSQTKAVGTLHDAEVMAARQTSLALERENEDLRQGLDTLSTQVQTLQAQLFAAQQRLEQQQQYQKDHIDQLVQQRLQHFSKAAEVTKSITSPIAVVKASTASQPDPILTPSCTGSRDGAISSPQQSQGCPQQLVHTASRSVVRVRTPSTGLIARRYLEGTPGARPVSWVVAQANTEVKRLRERAERLDLPVAGGVRDEPDLWRLREQLVEALAVIEEQDRLIHEALCTHLPGRPFGAAGTAGKNSDNFSLREDFEFDDDGAECSAMKASSASASTSSTSTNGGGGGGGGEPPKGDDEDEEQRKRRAEELGRVAWEDFRKELVPPSPATYELLRDCGVPLDFWPTPKSTPHSQSR